jgi:hypothetical protein
MSRLSSKPRQHSSTVASLSLECREPQLESDILNSNGLVVRRQQKRVKVALYQPATDAKAVIGQMSR